MTTSTPVRALSSGQANCGVGGMPARTIGRTASSSARVNIDLVYISGVRATAQLSQNHAPWRRIERDLGDHLLHDRLAERVVVLRHHHEGSGATDHVVPAIPSAPPPPIALLP